MGGLGPIHYKVCPNEQQALHQTNKVDSEGNLNLQKRKYAKWKQDDKIHHDYIRIDYAMKTYSR